MSHLSRSKKCKTFFQQWYALGVSAGWPGAGRCGSERVHTLGKRRCGGIASSEGSGGTRLGACFGGEGFRGSRGIGSLSPTAVGEGYFPSKASLRF